MVQCRNCGQDNPPQAQFCASCGAVLVTTVKPSVALPSAITPPPAVAAEHIGFWMRLAAAMIDFLIISVAMPITRILGSATGFFMRMRAVSPVVTFLLVFWLYSWLLTGLRGQTVGKMLLGIKVIDEEGNVPGLGRAALREILGKLISFVVLYLGFLWIAWDRQKQGWHDKIAHTYVVKVK